MTWALDGTAEREFAGTGPSVTLTNITAAGGGSANSDYLIFAVTSLSGIIDVNFRLTSLVITDDDNPGDGGAMLEIFRGRLEHNDGGFAEDVQQFWVQRNADFSGGPLDIEAAPALLRAVMNASGSQFADWHLGLFIMRSDAMPLGGSILDFLEGGFSQCQQDQVASDSAGDSPDFGALTIVNAFNAADIGCVARLQNPAASISGAVPACDVQSYVVFGTLLQTHTRVSASMTSRIDMGIGMAANQCLAKTNLADNAVLSLGAIRISESAVAGGPLIPFFDGSDDDGRTNEPDLSTSGQADPEGASPVIAQVVATEDPPAGSGALGVIVSGTTALLDLAARTATISTPDQISKTFRGVKLIANVTVIAGGENLVFTIQGKDPISGKYYSILSTPEITSAGLVVLTVHPGLITVANVAFNNVIPDTWRAVVTHSAGGSHTYQLSASSLE